MSRNVFYGSAIVAGAVLAGFAHGCGDNPEADPSRRMGCDESVTVPIGERSNSSSVLIDYERRIKEGDTNRTEVYTALVELTMKNGGVDGIDISARYDTNKKAVTAYIPAKGHSDDLFPGGPEEQLAVFPESKQKHDRLVVSIDPTFHRQGSGTIKLGTMCTGRLYDFTS